MLKQVCIGKCKDCLYVYEFERELFYTESIEPKTIIAMKCGRFPKHRDVYKEHSCGEYKSR